MGQWIVSETEEERMGMTRGKGQRVGAEPGGLRIEDCSLGKLTQLYAASSRCNYRDLLQYLNLTENKDLRSMSQPVLDSKDSTDIYLDVALYAILDVQEKEQKFITYIWVDMQWRDHYIIWKKSEFCGIDRIHIPTTAVWTPDVTIEEMTEKNKAPQTPYIMIFSDGEAWLRNNMVLVTSCKMQVYTFPFDTQKCNISFKSVIHSDKHMKLIQHKTSQRITKWSLDVMQTQSEWLFINITFINKTLNNFGINQSMIVYTITMKRRSVLYVVNFIVPILLFLGLDLASFLISDSGGEKLSFKVTVLLAVTVMQLILNEILPSSSDRIPLIAIYCIGIFGFMMLSLLETILVMYLMEKDSASQAKEDRDKSLSEDCKDKRGKVSFHKCFRDVELIRCASACDASTSETPSELLQVAKEGSSSQLTKESQDFEKEVMKALALLLSSRKIEEEPGYWNRTTKTINKVFFIIYITTVTSFLFFMFISWNTG
uniref:5-hydroxytryptamine receptor 3A-like n=1 Tax=Semicossyphus pulcher TaxID=241346 RepID=UPI0037E9C3DC